MPDGTPLPVLLQSLGYAFATTSYRQNGLAILEGVDDLDQLLAAFTEAHGVASKTLLAGISEGGLVVTLLTERRPRVATSTLAACGPIGSFQGLLDYWGDFRVLFDYYFPNLLPGTPIRIPAELMADWETRYKPAVVAAVTADPDRARKLLHVARTPYDPAEPATVVQSVLDVLWYNVFATNDAVRKLGGNPYGNRLRLYFGSGDDGRLNQFVRRFTESPLAIDALRSYETAGAPATPLVALHTTGDDVVPFAQELLYSAKLAGGPETLFTLLPVGRYGHCNFTTTELLGAFQLIAK
jgi:pimeloyl-ACP methyl ester carboxylesterase